MLVNAYTLADRPGIRVGLLLSARRATSNVMRWSVRSTLPLACTPGLPGYC
jgi:hypothetical protein